MPTWVRNGTGTAPSSTGADLTGAYALDNGTAPGDFNPANVTSVRIQYSITGAGFVDDYWQIIFSSHEVALKAGSGGTQLAIINPNTTSTLGNGSSSVDKTDSSPNTGASVANWEAGVLEEASIAEAWARYTVEMKADDGTLTASLVTVTITYTTGSQSLTGVLFTPGLSFPTGTVAPQAVSLTGVLFTPTLSFPAGVTARNVFGAPGYLDFDGSTTFAERTGKSLGSGDYEAFFYIAADDWSNGSDQFILAQWESPATSQAFRFNLSTTGQLQVFVIDSTTTQRAWNTAAVPWTNGVGKWIRLWFDADAGGSLSDLRIYTSDEPPWRDPLDIDWGAAAYNPTDLVNMTRQTLTTETIVLGSYNQGIGSMFGGLVWYAAFYDGLVADAGTKIIEFDVRTTGPVDVDYVDDGVDAVDWLLDGTGWAYIDSVFRPTLTFPSGTVAQVQSLTGVLFTPGLTFAAGTVTPGSVSLTGVLFTPTLTFAAGSVDPISSLTGALFTVGLLFPTGSVAVQAVTLTGSLFIPVLSFPTGAVTTEQNLTGVLFTPGLSFPAGDVSTAQQVDGVLFTPAISFPTGAVTSVVELTGVLFTVGISYPSGAVTTNTYIAGALFTPAISFPSGTVAPGSVDLTGALFTPAISFPSGVVAGAASLIGVLFSPTLSFPAGGVSVGAVNLTGVLFTVAPSFPNGAVTTQNSITGVLFTISPTFPLGTVFNSDQYLTGVLFTPSLVFPAGSVTDAAQQLDGDLFTPALLFPSGFVIQCTTAGFGEVLVGIWRVGVDEECRYVLTGSVLLIGTALVEMDGTFIQAAPPGHDSTADVLTGVGKVEVLTGAGDSDTLQRTGSVTVRRRQGNTRPIKG